MKTLLLATLLSTFAAMMSPAQTFTLLHTFAGPPDDGSLPQGQLIQGPDGTIYGTTIAGGTHDAGTVFKVQPDGSGYQVLWSLPGAPGPRLVYAGLALGGNTLYGTSVEGGANNEGAVFRVETDGSNPGTIYNIGTTNTDGDNLIARLWLDGTTLYGTSPYSQDSDNRGLVFSLDISGTNFQVLRSFGNFDLDPEDGMSPQAGLCLGGSTLYGTTASGGDLSTNNLDYLGTVFKIDTDGGNFSVITRFEGSSVAGPNADLILGGDTLFGAATGSGSDTLFRVNTDGSGLQVLHVFPGSGSSNDGLYPNGPLTLIGNTLYGTTQLGTGTNTGGVIFKLNTNGTDYTILHSFRTSTPNTNGVMPLSGLLLGGGQFFGTADEGGTAGYGTLFSLTYRSATPTNLVYHADGSFSLSYLLGTNYLGTNYTYILQATTNLGAAAWQPLATNLATTNLWIFTDTDASALPTRFYRVLSY
jgi:uncharacterized repeat protein (TIGR03803 family)